MNTKLSSLTIFFPFYNDSGTVEESIDLAYKIGREYTDDLEVIAIHGGPSKDDTFDKIKEMQKKYPKLVIVDKTDNTEGYAVIKNGFNAATKDWVFYTDGDRQYHMENDFQKLVKAQFKTDADIVNGYKKERGDNVVRLFLGNAYATISSLLFELPIRDTDCDFRLMRMSKMKKITLESHDASILPELIKKLQIAGAKFTEVPVSHFERVYGKSNYTAFSLLKEKVLGDFKLYMKMRKIKKGGGYRIISFGMIGVVSVVLQTVSFNFLLLFSAIQPAAATVLSDQLVIVISFILNNSLTFRNKLALQASLLKKFVQFYITVIVSTLVQALIVYIGTSMFGNNIIVSNVSFVIGLGIGFLWNYTIQSRIIWKKQG